MREAARKDARTGEEKGLPAKQEGSVYLRLPRSRFQVYHLFGSNKFL